MTRGLRALSLALLLCSPSVLPAQTVPPLLPAEGLTDPTLALGLSGLSDWGTNRPFIDQMMTARGWFGAGGDDWETLKTKDLADGGFLDADGWVTRMPPGIHTIRTIWAYPGVAMQERAGTYVLTYEGEGSLSFQGDAQRIDGRPGRITFRTNGGGFWLNITEIDPRGVGRPLRNIRIVQDKHLELFEAGVTFRPEWIESIRDARLIRFMDWQGTNGSQVGPGDLPLLESMGNWRMRRQGLPVSVMVALANQIGADPWFCMPHMADDAYVRAFAEYVYAHLDPDLVAHVEYSNEVWNEAFPQGRWVREQGAATFGVPYSNEAGYSFTVREATRDALIWEDVFGADAPSRLRKVLPGQATNVWAMQQLLDAPIWAEAEPDQFMPPSAVFDAFAITTYFGGTFISNEDLRTELVRRVLADPADARRWLTERLLDPEQIDTPTTNGKALAEQHALAAERGLALLAYEGGQHVHHAWAVPGLTDADVSAVTDFMISYVRSPDMARVTALNWDIWTTVGDGPYMHFGDSAAGEKWGSFSLTDAPGVENPTSLLLHERNRTTPSWWGDPGGPRYQQGRRIDGNDRDNALSGTDRGDVLLAKGGDDLLNPGPGPDDHIHGGDGQDTVLLPDPPDRVTFAPDGPRVVATGPSGRWHLFSVERIRFPDGSEIDTPSPDTLPPSTP